MFPDSSHFKNSPSIDLLRADLTNYLTLLTTLRVFLIYLFTYLLIIYLFLAVLGLHCQMWVFSSCGKQGLLFAVHWLLIAVASLIAEHRL